MQPTFTWKTQNVFDPLPPAPPFDDISDPQFESTIDSFKRYVPDELLQYIAEATQANIFTSTGKEVSLTKEDIEIFFGISSMMSYLKFPRIRMYWASRTKVLDIAKAMPRDKYFIIRNYLRVRDYGEVTVEEKNSNIGRFSRCCNLFVMLVSKIQEERRYALTSRWYYFGGTLKCDSM